MMDGGEKWEDGEEKVRWEWSGVLRSSGGDDK